MTLLLGLCVTLLPAFFQHAEGSYPYPLKMRETVIPEFDSTPLAVSVQPGETAMLPCRVRNLGDKDVSWLRGKDFMVISHGRAVFTRDPRFRVVSPDNDPSSWNLQLRNARLTDEGLYECQVNTDPKIQQRILLTVSDGREDTVILGSKIRYVKLGNSLSLTCQVRLQTGLPRQRPPRLVDWHLNNKSLFDVEGRSVAVDTEKNGNEVSSTLTVGRLTQDHSGIYTCRPLVANTTASVMVHVLDGERTAAMQGPGPLASEVNVNTAPAQLSRPALFLCLALFTSKLWFLVI